MAVRNGEHYLGGDDTDTLALIITRLLSHPTRMQQLSDAARQFVREQHDWSRAAAQLESVYARLAAQAPLGNDRVARGLLPSAE